MKRIGIDHLHEENSVLTMRKHDELLTKQYLIACYMFTHPKTVQSWTKPPPRRIRLDFTTYKSVITHFMPTIVDQWSVREAQNSLHQATVMTARNQLKHNRVINWHPPRISDTESRLPRVIKIILTQPRSGWSNILNSYRKIGNRKNHPGDFR